MKIEKWTSNNLNGAMEEGVIYTISPFTSLMSMKCPNDERLVYSVLNYPSKESYVHEGEIEILANAYSLEEALILAVKCLSYDRNQGSRAYDLAEQLERLLGGQGEGHDECMRGNHIEWTDHDLPKEQVDHCGHPSLNVLFEEEGKAHFGCQ